MIHEDDVSFKSQHPQEEFHENTAVCVCVWVLSRTALTLQQQSSWDRANRSSRPELVTLWPFSGKVCQPRSSSQGQLESPRDRRGEDSVYRRSWRSPK